ncbi:hypothetical protein NKG94_32270 [Micromonospora sp. M12]
MTDVHWTWSGEHVVDAGSARPAHRRGRRGLARQIAPYRLSQQLASNEEPLARSTELPDLLGVVTPRRWTQTTWRPRGHRDRLRIPLGVGPDGNVVELDFRSPRTRAWARTVWSSARPVPARASCSVRWWPRWR